MRYTQNLLDALADYTNALYREKGTFTEDLAKIIGDGLKENELEEVIINLSLQLRARKTEL